MCTHGDPCKFIFYNWKKILSCIEEADGQGIVFTIHQPLTIDYFYKHNDSTCKCLEMIKSGTIWIHQYYRYIEICARPSLQLKKIYSEFNKAMVLVLFSHLDMLRHWLLLEELKMVNQPALVSQTHGVCREKSHLIKQTLLMIKKKINPANQWWGYIVTPGHANLDIDHLTGMT